MVEVVEEELWERDLSRAERSVASENRDFFVVVVVVGTNSGLGLATTSEGGWVAGGVGRMD